MVLTVHFIVIPSVTAHKAGRGLKCWLKEIDIGCRADCLTAGLFRALNMLMSIVHLKKIEESWVSPVIWAREHLFVKHLLGHISVLDLNHTRHSKGSAKTTCV